MAEDGKALALAAKERGNALFKEKKNKEALEQYTEAIGHDPENHVLHANGAACHIEIATAEWDPKKKVEAFARAQMAAQQCTTLSPSWAKGYVRQSTAEFELIAAIAKMEDRKKQDEKWEREDAERAAKDPELYKDSSYGKKDYTLDESVVATLEAVSYLACEASCRKGLDLEPANLLLRCRLQALRDAGHATDEAKDREMRLPDLAAPLKAEGNKAFAAKRWKEAAEQYTKALEQDPFDHVFYSNRSACYAEDAEYEKALADAERCIAINPAFAKGYSRHAHALFHVGRYVDMEAAATRGLEIDGSSAVLQDLLKQAQAETKESLDVQRHMHQLRKEKAQDQKMQALMSQLNMGGSGVQMFSPGGMGGSGDLSSLLSGLGGGGNMAGGMGGLGGSGKSRMTEDQMRGMAKAMAQAPKDPAPAAPAAAAGPAPAPAPAAASPPAAGDGSVPTVLGPS